MKFDLEVLMDLDLHSDQDLDLKFDSQTSEVYACVGVKLQSNGCSG